MTSKGGAGARERRRARLLDPWRHQPCPVCGRELSGKGVCWREDAAVPFCGWRPWRPVSRLTADHDADKINSAPA